MSRRRYILTIGFLATALFGTNAVSGGKLFQIASDYSRGKNLPAYQQHMQAQQMIRQTEQENQQLGVPRSVAAEFPERLQRLIGYGVYRNLIGHINKRDPRELLGGEGAMRAIWDL